MAKVFVIFFNSLVNFPAGPTPSPGHLSSSSLFPYPGLPLGFQQTEGLSACCFSVSQPNSPVGISPAGAMSLTHPCALQDRWGRHSASILYAWIGKGWKKASRHRKFSPVRNDSFSVEFPILTFAHLVFIFYFLLWDHQLCKGRRHASLTHHASLGLGKGKALP